jgi:hypothetical protein
MKSCARGCSRQAAMFFLMASTALRSVSMKLARSAPRDKASSPIAPEPAKTSSTFASRTAS